MSQMELDGGDPISSLEGFGLGAGGAATSISPADLLAHADEPDPTPPPLASRPPSSITQPLSSFRSPKPPRAPRQRTQRVATTSTQPLWLPARGPRLEDLTRGLERQRIITMRIVSELACQQQGFAEDVAEALDAEVHNDSVVAQCSAQCSTVQYGVGWHGAWHCGNTHTAHPAYPPFHEERFPWILLSFFFFKHFQWDGLN